METSVDRHARRSFWAASFGRDPLQALWPIFRFKVYALGQSTKRIVSALQALAPDRQLNEWFMRIVTEGTNETFDHEHNARWLEVTRPIVESFFHARYFLEMAVTYGQQLRAPPRILPSGWAAPL